MQSPLLSIPMHRRSFLKTGINLGLVSTVALMTGGCIETSPTGRMQLITVSEEEEIQLSLRSEQQILSESTIATKTKQSRLVEQVGKKLAAVSGRPNIDWKFYVIEDPTINAFCIPGGQVFFYTGILDLMKNDEAYIATVMSHEIGHVVARHGAERVSQAKALATAGDLGALAVGASTGSALTTGAFQAAYGMGAKVGILLPYSRAHEYEADFLGLVYMIRAGYKPEKAADFWKLMIDYSAKQGAKGSESDLLSTHPADHKRVAELESRIPEAIAKAKEMDLAEGKA